VYDVTESVLLGQYEHRVEETFHCIRRLDKCRSARFGKCINELSIKKKKYEQFMSLIEKDDLQSRKNDFSNPEE